MIISAFHDKEGSNRYVYRLYDDSLGHAHAIRCYEFVNPRNDRRNGVEYFRDEAATVGVGRTELNDMVEQGRELPDALRRCFNERVYNLRELVLDR